MQRVARLLRLRAVRTRPKVSRPTPSRCHKKPVVLMRWRRLPLTVVPGTNSRVVSQSVSFGPKLRAALNDVLGGGAASVLNITFGLSYALLIFAGPLAPYLSYGVAATFISSAVLAAVIALGSSLPFAIGGPGEFHRGDDRHTGVVAGRTHGDDRSDRAAAGAGSHHAWPFQPSPPVIVLCGFGVTRMGRAIRYVPYPVVGGFLGATGCLILLGAIRVITGIVCTLRRSTGSPIC